MLRLGSVDVAERCSAGAQVAALEAERWRLSIPAGGSNAYRLAQCDDYASLARSRFPWRAPLSLRLEARASASDHAGTWGFGLWNDPFGIGVGSGGARCRLPTFPNAAWFFYSSPPSHLTLHDAQPGSGFVAATFRTLPVWGRCAPLSFPLVPLVLVRPLAKAMRPVLARIVADDARALAVDVCQWHQYRLDWDVGKVRFWIDGRQVFATEVTPVAPLGLVVWIDNQYAAYTPRGAVSYGCLATATQSWLEFSDAQIIPLVGAGRET